jgi:hypothetical protein
MTRTGILIALGVVAAAAVIVAVILTAGHPTAAHPTRITRPAPSAAAAATAEQQAFAAADRFCQPDLGKDAWQRSLAPYLTPAAYRLYSAVKPANVPCAGIHENGQPVGDQQTSTDQAFQFTASTGGPVTVTLHRDTKQNPWLASYINAGQ